MPKKGFIYDIKKCIGCKACQVACKDANNLDTGEFFRRVGSVEHEGKTIYYSGACNHCAKPLCVMGCPTGAMHIADDLTVRHNSGLCIGCGACTWNCPYGAPVLSKTKGIAQKCDACAKLRQAGEEPVCVQACITQCLSFGYIQSQYELASFLPPWQTTEPALDKIGAQQQEKKLPEAEDVTEPNPALEQRMEALKKKYFSI